MTDRYIGFAVVLEKSVREDDAQFIMNAMKMLKGVVAVRPIEMDPSAEYIAESRVKREVQDKLLEMCRTLNK